MKRYATAAAASRTAVSSPAAAPARTLPRRRSPVGTHPLLRLQQSYGNRFVQQWLQAQHEARPGASGDPGIDGGSGPGRIPGADGDTSLQQDIQRARGHGQPLPPHVRAPMEQALGADFSRVRLHADGEAGRLSRGLSAQAFTAGQDIFLRRGQADWASAAGRELIAHELTHVVQQRAAVSGAAPALSHPHDRHEREAGRTARAVAAGHQVAAAALTPATAPVIQRRYLDEPKDVGYRNWLDDTTATKGLTVTSREKLTVVDRLLNVVLTQQGTPAWFTSGWGDLEALDKALTQLKYDPAAAKTSAAFIKRLRAVQRLRAEIAIRREGLTELHHLTYGPKIVDLMEVGFVPSYLNELATADLDLLHQAHVALGGGHLQHAQGIFDRLNPPVRAGNSHSTPHWAMEPFTLVKQNPGSPDLYDFQRTRDDTMAAQRQLLAYHAQAIGGDYGQLLSYKPYKYQKLTDLRGANYFNSQSLRKWNTVKQGGHPTMAPNLKTAATERADEIAEQSTQASRARGKNKPDKAALTPSEVAAIRVYTSDEYREMNAVFRDFRVHQPTANWDKYSAIAKLAISGLGKLPKARGVISYRGDRDTTVGGHAGVLRQGATFRLPNFYSTTNNPGKAFPGQTGYIFSNDSYGRLIDRISTLPEGEVLLPPGATYKIAAQYDRPDQQTAWAGPDGQALSAAAQHFMEKDPNRDGRRRLLEFTEA